jgi:hypothetical protein
MRADRTFGSKILALIDRAIQLYFRACMDEDSRMGAARHLMFYRYQSEIIMNTFTFTTLPTIIANLISRKADTPSPFPGLDAFLPTASGPKYGNTPVFNHSPYPSFQKTAAQVVLLQRALSTAPTWSKSHPPCKPCPKFLSGGACAAECPRAATHRAPFDDEIGPYVQWIQTRGRVSTPNGNPTGAQGQRNPKRPSPIKDSTGSAHRRQRAGSPRVQFADEAKTGEDF